MCGLIILVATIGKFGVLRTHPDRERLRRIAAHWQPWRAVAARSLWHEYLAGKPPTPLSFRATPNL